jgi:hypothetical protein
MFPSFTFWFAVLAVLITYLFVSVSLRQRATERAALRTRAQQHPRISAFDTSAIAPQIERVRQDYTVSAHQRGRSSHRRTDLFAAAHRLLSEFPYFRSCRSDQEPRNHET